MPAPQGRHDLGDQLTPLLLALALQAPPACLPPTPLEADCATASDVPHRLACEVCVLRLAVQDRDAWLATQNAQAARWEADARAAQQRALLGWGLTVAGTGALAAGLVALADGHRTTGAIVAAAGAATGIGGLVVLRW